MNKASGFKRLGIACAALAVTAIGGFVVLSALIPKQAVRKQVTAEIRAVTGLEPRLRGAATMTLFPSSEVSFSDVELGKDGSGAPALRTERLIARLRLLPLLLGRIEIADVELLKPTISVTLEDSGRTNWTGLVRTLARSLKPNASAPSFSEIRIVGGTVLVRDQHRGLLESLTDANLALAWPSISKTFGATGRFVWHNEPIDASLTLSNFVSALSGHRSGLKLRLSGKPFKLAFDGHISAAPTLKIEGTLAADSPALREALAWAGQRPLPGGGFGRFALKAETKVLGGSIALTGVNVELDGNTYEGVLSIAGGRHKLVQGTLAADDLDVTPYISTARLVTGGNRSWSGQPISLDGFKGFDLDLRLSAAQVTISDAKLGRTAIAANLRGGDLVVTVGESQAFGGVIKGSLALGAADPGADLKAQLQFSDVDLEQCLGAMFGLRRLEGKGTIALALEASGGNVMALTQSMNGTATISGKDGALAGINIEQLLRRLERRPLSGGGNFRSGRTPFDKLDVALSIRKGTVSVDTMKIEGPAVRLALGGSASIPERDLDLKGTATLVAQVAGETGSSFALPFVVQGPWDDPLMLPDADILIRRSGAAAPLLKAVRERSRSTSIRSAIERLTGHSTAGALPAHAE